MTIPSPEEAADLLQKAKLSERKKLSEENRTKLFPLRLALAEGLIEKATASNPRECTEAEMHISLARAALLSFYKKAPRLVSDDGDALLPENAELLDRTKLQQTVKTLYPAQPSEKGR